MAAAAAAVTAASAAADDTNSGKNLGIGPLRGCSHCFIFI